ncbi:MAG: hypothetical protein MUF28_06995 [Ignavibacterium sp.]|nr:hypothetical protein [Ignavibacterium sp.]
MRSASGHVQRVDVAGLRPDEVETEQTARDAQFERLVEWAREVSKKTGIPLKGF